MGRQTDVTSCSQAQSCADGAQVLVLTSDAGEALCILAVALPTKPINQIVHGEGRQAWVYLEAV